MSRIPEPVSEKVRHQGEKASLSSEVRDTDTLSAFESTELSSSSFRYVWSVRLGVRPETPGLVRKALRAIRNVGWSFEKLEEV